MPSVELATFEKNSRTPIPTLREEKKKQQDFSSGFIKVYLFDPHFAIQITAELCRNLDKIILNIIVKKT